MSLNEDIYTLNHIRDPIVIYKVYSLIKGSWSLWGLAIGLGFKGAGV